MSVSTLMNLFPCCACHQCISLVFFDGNLGRKFQGTIVPKLFIPGNESSQKGNESAWGSFQGTKVPAFQCQCTGTRGTWAVSGANAPYRNAPHGNHRS